MGEYMYRKVCKRFLESMIWCLLIVILITRLREMRFLNIIPVSVTHNEAVWFDDFITEVDIIQLADAKLPVFTGEKIEKPKAFKEVCQINDEDYHNLLCLVQAEAGGEDLEGKILVGNVVMNRVRSDKFPDTVSEVIFQRNEKTVQFSPTKREDFKEIKISEETEEAVKLVLSGVDNSEGALFFAARKYAKAESMSWFDTKLQYLFKHGGHEFYKAKEKTE